MGKFDPPVECSVCTIFNMKSEWSYEENLKIHMKDEHSMLEKEINKLVLIIKSKRGRNGGQEKEGKKTKKRKSVSVPVKAKAPIGEKTLCPKCKKGFSKAANVRKHLQVVHKLKEEEVQGLEINTTTKRCEFCGFFFGNVYAHQKVCKKKTIVRADVKERSVEEDGAPAHFVPGGERLLREWDTWVEKKGLKKNTIKVYRRKLKELIKFWEEKMKGFYADSLVFPLETEVCFPSLAMYLDECTTGGAKITAMKTYNWLAGLILSLRFTGMKEFSLEKKNSFKQDVITQRDQFSKLIKGQNKINAEATAKRSAEKQADPEVLERNPQRMKELMVFLLNNESVKKMLKDMAKMNPEEMGITYGEKNCREFLLGLILMTGGGERPSAAARTKVSELKNAKDTGDGTMVVTVIDHKTLVTQGPCPIPFISIPGIFEGLYEATLGYMRAFREDDDQGYLFATSEGGEADPRESISWLKKNIFADFLTAKEMMSFTPKVPRKAWSNWGANHPDPEVRRIALKTMCHSEVVQERNYAVVNIRNAGRFTKRMVSNIMKKGTKDDGESSDEAENEEGEDKTDEDQGEDENKEDEDSHQESMDEDKNNGDSSEDEEMFRSRAMNMRNSTFTNEERSLLRNVFFKNGKPPKSMTQKMATSACQKNEGFKKLFKVLYKKKDS